MCGIVGYLGPSRVAPILLSELRFLEYRGYDSAGVAIVEDGQLFVVKAAGKLSNLEALLNEKKPTATVGIGHTRWATHGEPNDQNAHPHMDCSGTIAIVHNGIIENYLVLKDELTNTGHTFVSQTDTEVVAHLIEEEYTHCTNMLEAIQRSVRRLKGAFALGIINQNHPDRLYAVNQHYSLVIGIGNGETFLASDSVAVCQYTNKILRLEQSEIAELASTGTKLFQFDGREVKRDALVLDTNPYVISKEGYKHFLLKEIHEQPLVMRQTLSKYLSHPDNPINFSVLHESLNNGNEHQCGIHLSNAQLRQINRILITACGTAYYSGLVGKYIIEELCDIPCDVDIASELAARKVLADKHTLAIAVSQSGETADTLAAVGQAANSEAMVLGITNRQDSHLAQVSPNLIVTECGVEVSVAATKTFVAQLTSFYLLALYLAEQRRTITQDKARNLKQKLMMVPAMQEQVLASASVLRSQVLAYAESSDVVY
ncbi:MAG: glutamine--fructose-6-phosphate transaminase (isomerizing), partial [Candidatus Melainabacteria bacterium]|nr:glutamine--fructose-6-phosphate transaminase (isomerizing) [Candidatus Melainabacteria bacterium]